MANRPYIDQWEIDGVAHDILPYNGNPAIEGYGGNNLTEEFENAARDPGGSGSLPALRSASMRHIVRRYI